jgi:general secretion pathway protein D
MKLLQLRGFFAVLLAASLVLGPVAPAAFAKTKNGDKLFKQAQAAEVKQQYALAADLYTKAVDEDPKDAGYLIGMRRARFAAGMEMVEKARVLRAEGNMPEAIAEFQRAILMDPSSSIAMQELRRTQEMLAQPTTNPGMANLTPSERANKESADRAASLMGLPELNPPVRKVGPLKMNNQPINILYNTVAGIAGVSVVWDSTWTRPTRGFDVEINSEMGVEQAFEYLGLVTRTYWKVLTPTTIFVTEESANKRRDYTDNVVKTFFVTNAATAQEFNEIQTAVRTITDIRRVYPYVAQKAIVVRGDADAVALAEKLIRDLDKPKAEVVIDVIVMEANSARTKDLAATIVQASGDPGLNLGAVFTPRAGIAKSIGSGDSATSGIPFSNLGRLSTGDWTTTLPGALLKAILTDNNTKVLNNPQLRASDGQKARLEIGDRIPIASGSFQTGVTGASGVGVNTTFQFQPVGVIVDITPQVHSTSEVTLHVELEISNVKRYITVGTVDQPIVGQNKSTADLRLREGEVNILAGLTRDQESNTTNGIPGLVNIPVLGKYLFGSTNVTKDHGDLMIALIPHIVRTPDYSPENLRGISAGVDQQLKLTYAPKPDGAGSGPAVNGGAVPATPPATAPAPAAPKPGQPPATAAPVTGAGARVTFNPGVIAVPANAPFTVNVQVENAADASSVTPLRVSWDPAILRLNDIAPGELLSRDGGRVTSVKDIRNDSGQASLTISRTAGSAGVNGSGSVATLTFVALAPGSGRITVTELGLMDTQNRASNVALSAVPVTVQ